MTKGWANRRSIMMVLVWLAAVLLAGAAAYSLVPADEARGQDGGIGEEAFVRFEGLEGPSVVTGYEGWNELLGLQQQAVVPIDTSQTRVTGAVTYAPLVIVKGIDSISPELMHAMSTGRSIPSVEIHLRKTNADSGMMETFYQITLQNVQIASYELTGTGDAASSGPREELGLAFQRIGVRYFRSGERETEFSWDTQSRSTR